jgi:conjugal transfer pilus assembly protein TraF
MFNMQFKVWCLLVIAFLDNHTLAFTMTERPQGFLWYNEVPKPQGEERVELQRAVSPTVVKTIAPWDLRIKALKQEFETAQRKALDNPTLANVVAAQKLQKVITDKSERFADMWQLATLLDPNLLITGDRGNSLYQRVHDELKLERTDKQLTSIANDYGLIFQFEPGCRYCEVFAPIVQDFAKGYKFQLLGVSRRGGVFHGIEAIADTGMLEELNPARTVPTLYLISADGRKIHPVARGVISSDKLKENILAVYRYYQGITHE